MKPAALALQRFADKWGDPDLLPELVDSGDLAITEHRMGRRFPEAYVHAVTLVGLPLPTLSLSNSLIEADADPARLRASIGASASEPILLVLPGSRPSEIERVMPAFEDAVRRLKAQRPTLQVVVPTAYTVAEAVKARVAGWPFRAHLIEDEGLKDDAFLAGDVALACSGTVTTELALAGCPMVVGYKTGAITYAIVKRLMKPRWVTLFNIAAGRAVAPEFIQQECEGERLAREIALRLDDPALREKQQAEQYLALDKMGRGMPDPSEAAAEALLSFLRPPTKVPA